MTANCNCQPCRCTPTCGCQAPSIQCDCGPACTCGQACAGRTA